MCVMNSSVNIKVSNILKSFMVLALFFAISCKANCPVTDNNIINYYSHINLEMEDQSGSKDDFHDDSGDKSSMFNDFRIIVQ